jgi:hypothetical protein
MRLYCSSLFVNSDSVPVKSQTQAEDEDVAQCRAFAQDAPGLGFDPQPPPPPKMQTKDPDYPRALLQNIMEQWGWGRFIWKS